LSPADIIFHEAGPGAGHTSLERLEALPSDIREKLRLVHDPDEWTAADSNFTFVREGQFFTVGC
jgi:hypothetical protein